MPDDRPAILFDVDGTLVDTNYFHTVAWWRAFQDIGEQVPMSSIHPLIGMGSDQLVERLIGRESEEATELHSEHYEPFKDDIKAFPKASELLRESDRRGARVVLATSSGEEDVPRLCQAVGAGDAVDYVVSKGDVEKSKPAPDIFEAALDRAGLRAEDAAAVGDTTWDVLAARRCGLSCVALQTGGIAAAELVAAGAAAVYEDPSDLLEQLSTSPLARLLDQPR